MFNLYVLQKSILAFHFDSFETSTFALVLGGFILVAGFYSCLSCIGCSNATRACRRGCRRLCCRHSKPNETNQPDDGGTPIIVNRPGGLPLSPTFTSGSTPHRGDERISEGTRTEGNRGPREPAFERSAFWPAFEDREYLSQALPLRALRPPAITYVPQAPPMSPIETIQMTPLFRTAQSPTMPMDTPLSLTSTPNLNSVNRGPSLLQPMPPIDEQRPMTPPPATPLTLPAVPSVNRIYSTPGTTPLNEALSRLNIIPLSSPTPGPSTAQTEPAQSEQANTAASTSPPSAPVPRERPGLPKPSNPDDP